MSKLVSSGGIFVGCNRQPHVLDWNSQFNVIAFGGSTDISVVNVKENSPFHISESLKHHSKPINSVRWLKKSEGSSAYLISTSVDGSCALWKFSNDQFLFIAELEKRSSSLLFACGFEQKRGEITAVVIGTDFISTVIHGVVDTDTSGKKEWNSRGKKTLEIHKGLVFCADFIQLQEVLLLALGCDDNKIRIFCSASVTEDYKMTQVISGHSDWIRSVTFGSTGNGDVLLASCSQDNYIRLWRFQLKQTEIFKKSVGDELTLPGQRFNIGENICEVTLEAVLSGHEDWVYSVCWHPFLTKGIFQLLSASMDKCIIVWEPDSGSGVWLEKTRLGDVGGNTLGFYGCAFSPDGLSVIGHSYQGGLSMWTLNKDVWQPQVVSTGHFGSVEDLVWDPAGSYLLSCSSDQTTRLFAPWNKEGGKVTYHELARPQIHGHDIQCIAAINSLCFVSGAEEKILRAFRAPANFVSNMAAIAKMEFDPILLKEDLPEGASVPALGLSNKAVGRSEAAESPDNLSGEANELYPVVVFQPYQSTIPPTEDVLMQNTLWPEVHKLYGHGYELFAVAANHSGTIIASGCKASRLDHAAITIWSTTNWNPMCKLEAHSLTVTQIVFSPDDSHMLTVSRDRTWALFSRQSSDFEWTKCYQTDKKTAIHSRIIWGAAWTPDSQHFVTVSRDKKVILWNSSDYTAVSDHLNMPESVTAVDVAPVRGKTFRYLVALGLENGLIFLYSVTEDLRFTETWKNESDCHSMTVKKVKFRPRRGLLGVKDSDDFIQLASCGDDHFVRIFNINLSLIQ